MAYGDFKDSTRRTASDKTLRDKAFNIAKNEDMSGEQLAEELHKPIIKKFKKRKVQPPFIYNICSADLADMQLISKFNKRIRF